MSNHLDRLMGDHTEETVSSDDDRSNSNALSDDYPDTTKYNEDETYDNDEWPNDVEEQHRRAHRQSGNPTGRRPSRRRHRKESNSDDTRKKQFVIRADQDRALNRELASENYTYGKDRSEVIRTLLDKAGFCD